MRYKRKLNLASSIFLLFMIGMIVENIDKIINVLLNLLGVFIIVSGVCIIIYFILKQVYTYIRYGNKEYSPFEINRKIKNMNPREFEVFCANLFKGLGYNVELTQPTNDYGRDIIIEKDNQTTYVECKRWNKNTGFYVGRQICEKLIGACASSKGVRNAIIINTGKYHNNAYEYTERVNNNGEFYLELWDIKDILKALKKIDSKKIGITLNCLKE